jgi:DNA-binding LacI/PurR family transcriptional regulator
MADIARLAGVARSTVSRALAGSTLVNEETRSRIAELARTLNYSVNVGAQNLRLKQNKTVAVVVPYDPSTRQHLSDPFFLALIGSIADALTDRGYDMLLSRVNADHLDFASHAYDSGRAMGVILIGQWRHHDQLNEMALRGIPFVVWGANMPRQLYCTVGGDNFQGGRAAARHLLEQGARNIAFVGDTELPEVQQRYEGYVQAHDDFGVRPDPKLCLPSPFVPDAVQSDVQRLMDQGARFDGLFAASDLIAMTAISTLRQNGKEVPRDVAVVGYDDIALAGFFQPPLTTVRQPIEAAGAELVETLIKLSSGERPASVQLVTELIVRASSATGLPHATA